jgi:hypothetical protein
LILLLSLFISIESSSPFLFIDDGYSHSSPSSCECIIRLGSRRQKTGTKQEAKWKEQQPIIFISSFCREGSRKFLSSFFLALLFLVVESGHQSSSNRGVIVR